MASVLFIRGDIFERGADLTVLPCSAQGYISRTAEGHVHRFGLPLPAEKLLGEIEILPFPGAGRFTRYVAWAASVRNYKSSPETITMIGQHLAEYANQHPKIQIIESPLLGTGAGELDPIVAGNALRDGFMAKCHTGAALMIYGQQATIIDCLRNSSAESDPDAETTARTPTPDFEYDVALSFAGEQREHARAIAACLTARGINVFFDEHHEANLWGKDLAQHLAEVYEHSARYCLMLISQSYAEKVWTTHEARSALARALAQKTEYILPVRFDATALPGLHHTISTVAFDKHGPEGIAQLLIRKLGRDAGTPPTATIITTPATVVLAATPRVLDESRRLTPQQQTQIKQELVTGDIGHVTIQYLRTGSTRIDKEPGDFALQLEETLRSAGWRVTLQTMSTFRGWIGTSITKPRDKPPLAEAQTLFQALSAAGVDVYYNETGLSIDDQPMLLIGKNGD